MAVSLSIIIPCANDAVALAACLERLLSAQAEIIIADASATDECAEVALAAGARLVRCPERGRGPQMNAGAAVATGTVLVFNHCDTHLTAAHLQSIQRAMMDTSPPLLAGAFYKDLAHHYPKFAWANSFVRWWSLEWGIIYGDQTMLLRRDHFEQLGGFPHLPIMEDIAMSDLLRAAGGLALLDPPLRTSMRRFHRRGFLRTRLENFLLVLLFRCGLSAQCIYRWYYRKN